jgi:hypothetical protein
MMKRFVLVFLTALLALPGLLHAQDTLFTAPDTVCVRQAIRLLPTQTNASSYYWSFCPGTLASSPTTRNLGRGYQFRGPAAIEAAKDDNGRYYAFIVNRTEKSLVRLDFGTTLSNLPLVTPMGSYDTTVPDTGGGMHLMRSKGNWYLFLTGGSNATNSSLARFDFGNSLANRPISVNMGNPGGVLNAPKDLYIAQEADQFYGYVLNAGSSTLVRVDFGTNLSITPRFSDLGNIGSLSRPGHLTVSQINNTNRVYVTNVGNSSLTILNFGSSFSNAPTGTNLSNLYNNLFQPAGLAYYRDCDRPYLLIANTLSNTAIRVRLDANGEVSSSPADVTAVLSAANDFSAPTGMTRFLRDSSNLYAYVVNSNNSLTEVKFGGCTRATVAASTNATPPVYSYDTTGTYTVNLTINDGLPNMRTYCRQIVVLPQPGVNISNDTLICQGDTINLVAQSLTADSLRWSPNYNITSTVNSEIRVFPERTTDYRVYFSYPDGCAIDTGVTVRVVEAVADAGPDRTLVDGSSTTLGGPLTSRGAEYTYQWSPATYLDDPAKAFPVAQPFTNYTYYFTVIHTTPELVCRRTDSVTVRTLCEDITLPNAFAPESSIDGIRRFGLLNKQLVKLISFRIFNRWGQQVYNSSDLTAGWDGQFNGGVAEAGVYVWEVDGFCPSGQRITKSGDVTLIR